MKNVLVALATVAVLSAPIAASAQSRGGGGHGGGSHNGLQGGGYRNGGPGDGQARTADRSSSLGARGAWASRGSGYRGFRGPGRDFHRGYGYGYGHGYRHGYPYWGGLNLGFALGFGLADPWYYAPYGFYGYYAPAYAYTYSYGYGPAGPAAPYDDPYQRDYGQSGDGAVAPPTAEVPPGGANDNTACGSWVWLPDQSKYQWNAGTCQSAAPPPTPSQ